jgi:CubicO group peptidase (beta-lactamase class C family)
VPVVNQAELQALLDRQLRRGHVYNAVVGVRSRDGSLDVTAAAGIADPEYETAMTADTPYAIASITKMYTAAAILTLHERGLVDLDETITAYLPGNLLAGIHVYRGTDHRDRIKVYQLVNQTSGLPDYFLDKPRGGRSVYQELAQGHDRALDLSQVLAIVRNLRPKFPPGERAAYADTNYRLLGAIIEAVTGTSLADAFQEMIFAPLDLKHTHLYRAAESPPGERPAMIYLRDRPVRLQRSSPPTLPMAASSRRSRRAWPFSARSSTGAVRPGPVRPDDPAVAPGVLPDEVRVRHDAGRPSALVPPMARLPRPDRAFGVDRIIRLLLPGEGTLSGRHAEPDRRSQPAGPADDPDRRGTVTASAE